MQPANDMAHVIYKIEYQIGYYFFYLSTWKKKNPPAKAFEYYKVHASKNCTDDRI